MIVKEFLSCGMILIHTPSGRNAFVLFGADLGAVGAVVHAVPVGPTVIPSDLAVAIGAVEAAFAVVATGCHCASSGKRGEAR